MMMRHIASEPCRAIHPARQAVALFLIAAAAIFAAPDAAAATTAGANGFGGFLPAGIRVVLPGGNEQILFLIAIFLASPRTDALIVQFIAWVAGHSLTLWLVGLGALKVPADTIAWLVPLTVALVAAENLLFGRKTKFKTGLVFVYGLIHGMSFAQTYHAIPVSGDSGVMTLVGFNLGLEVAHAAVLGLAFAASLYFRGVLKQASRMDLYRPMIVVPVSLAILVTAAIWTIRAFTG